MAAYLFLVVLLACAGEALVNSVSKKILAFAGQTVILPCHITVRDDLPTIEWSKEGLVQPNIAFLYRDGCETYEMKNPVFQYRTNLIMNELKYGNISLRISNVQLSDAGKYICITRRKMTQQVVRTLELVVGAVSDPKLSVVSAEGDEVTLQCEVDCRQTEPEITFLDDQGNNIHAENPKRYLDSRGFFTITRRATVLTATKRITCRVHRPEINHIRDAEIYMQGDYMRFRTLIFIATFLCGFLCGCAVIFLWKKYGNCVRRQKSPTQNSLAGSYHQVDSADDIRNANTELKSILHEKEETIRQLTEELNDLRSRQVTVVGQQNQPTIDKGLSKSSLDAPNPNNLPPDHISKASKFSHDNNPKPAALTNSNHPKSRNLPQNIDSKHGVLRQNGDPDSIVPVITNSSPALLTNNAAVSSSSSSASTSASEEKSLVRSMSMHESQPRPNRPQRRYTTSGRSDSAADSEAAARVLTKTKKVDNITPVFRSLH